MLKKTVSLFLIITLTLSLLACESTNREGEYLIFNDSLGNAVLLDKKPERVAVLLSSLAEMWIVAGGELAITVGESVERGFADSDVLLVDTGAGKSISTELLLSYEPDLVICSADIAAQKDVAQILSLSGIPVAQMRVDSFSDYLGVLDVMTDITGNKDAYVQYGSQLKERVDSLLASAPAFGCDVLFIRASTSAKSTKAKGTDQHFIAGMLSELGAHNIADDAPILLDGLNIESIIAADPDVILISTMGDEDAAREYMDSLLASPAWQTLTAVRSGACHYLPKEYSQFKPNTKWYEAYLMLWEILYAKAS